ncbi:MAG: ATP-binding protein [Candidatus Competibacter sp.]|nr:ATP-binding protein [Candidatus Competibacter sp.]
MKANPGGYVSPENVVGRDRFINDLWQILERQSLLLTAERRMGKTSIINKMKAQPSAGVVVRYRDVGAFSNPIEFVERVAEDVITHLTTLRRAAKRFEALLSSLGGTRIGGLIQLPKAVEHHWKVLLENALTDLAEHGNQRVILCWDELPWMLQKIARSQGQAVVVDLLDTLRGLRQTHANLRMVYTGSIGLRHVITALADDGYVNSPVNDMRVIEVPPLDLSDAEDLARALLQGEGLVGDPLDETAAVIVKLVDAIPFYIHHMVAALKVRGQTVTPTMAEEACAEALANDPGWDLEHFRERLGEYYGERAVVVRAVLDQLADNEPLGLDQLHERQKTTLSPDNGFARRIVEGDREALRTLLKLVQRDHYLRQQPDGCYLYRFDLIRRWWRLDRGFA